VLSPKMRDDPVNPARTSLIFAEKHLPGWCIYLDAILYFFGSEEADYNYSSRVARGLLQLIGRNEMQKARNYERNDVQFAFQWETRK
jgi:hypothetical protein